MRATVQKPVFSLLYQCGRRHGPNSELPSESYSEGKVVNCIEVICQTQLNFIYVIQQDTQYSMINFIHNIQ